MAVSGKGTLAALQMNTYISGLNAVNISLLLTAQPSGESAPQSLTDPASFHLELCPPLTPEASLLCGNGGESKGCPGRF